VGTEQNTHPKGFFFLFAGEFAERFSFYGMRAILPLYLSDQLGFGDARGGLYYTIFLGLCYFLPLVGGFIADNFLGKYWTIVGFSLPYVAGQFLVGFENPYVFVPALGLLAMGTGVIKPNISTLMGLTYDQQRPGQEKLRSNAFQYFYMAINIGAFLSQTIVPIVRTKTGSYFIAFCVPGVFMVIALAIFAAGKKYYAVETINRHAPPPTPEEKAERWRILGQLGLLFLLVTFFWGVFDQSSYTWVFFARTYMDRVVFGYELAPDQIQALNPLFIVAFIGGALVYRTFIAGATASQGAGMRPTTKMLIGFILTALCMGVMAGAGYLAGPKQPAAKLTLAEGEIVLPAIVGTGLESAGQDGGTALVSLGENIRLKATGWSYNADKKRASMSGGELIFDDGKTLVISNGRIDPAASRGAIEGGKVTVPSLETKIRPDALGTTHAEDGKSKATLEQVDWVKPAERVTVLWMALAFLVITLAEILISVTGLELAFVVAPQSMKGFITACWLLTVALANWFINAPIAGLYPSMRPGDYFVLLAGAGLLVAILFVPVSRKFNAGMDKANAERETAIEGNSEGA